MSETIKCVQCGGAAIPGGVHDGIANFPPQFVKYNLTGEGRNRRYRSIKGFTRGAELTVSFACQECGYIMTYLQRLLLKEGQE